MCLMAMSSMRNFKAIFSHGHPGSTLSRSTSLESTQRAEFGLGCGSTSLDVVCEKIEVDGFDGHVEKNALKFLIDDMAIKHIKLDFLANYVERCETIFRSVVSTL